MRADSPVARPPAVVCFDEGDAACAAKTGAADYDYLLLSQHWLPTFCAGLADGYDTTLTHRGEARCGRGTPARLAIHGLWPNYTAGFPQCCGEALPLDPAAVARWPAELRARLAAEWPDPAAGSAPDGVAEGAVCELLNHEWQKHGTCFTEPGDEGALRYFATGLELAARIADATAAVDGWAGDTVARSRLAALYPRTVRLYCDAARPDRLLEIHSCWSAAGEPLDCAPAGGFGPLVPCGDTVTLHLLAADGPQARAAAHRPG